MRQFILWFATMNFRKGFREIQKYEPEESIFFIKTCMYVVRYLFKSKALVSKVGIHLKSFISEKSH